MWPQQLNLSVKVNKKYLSLSKSTLLCTIWSVLLLVIMKEQFVMAHALNYGKVKNVLVQGISIFE